MDAESSSDDFAASDDGDKVWTGVLDLTFDIVGYGIGNFSIGIGSRFATAESPIIFFGTAQ